MHVGSLRVKQEKVLTPECALYAVPLARRPFDTRAMLYTVGLASEVKPKQEHLLYNVHLVVVLLDSKQ